MDDGFETSFVIQIAPERAWQALVDAEPPNHASSAMTAGPGEARRWWLPAFEAPGTELEVDPGRRLRVTKAAEPCAGTEIVVTLEAVGAGTRVTVVQSGFGTWFAAALDSLSIGWSHIAADLALFFERGVSGGRHLLPWAGIGCEVREVPAGLEVANVHTGGFAARVGVSPGDVLITVGGAPVVVLRELATLMRVFRSGDTIEATWAHGRDRMIATGVL